MKPEKLAPDSPARDRCLVYCSDQNLDGKPVGWRMGRIYADRTEDAHAKGEGMNGNWTFTHWCDLPGDPE